MSVRSTASSIAARIQAFQARDSHDEQPQNPRALSRKSIQALQIRRPVSALARKLPPPIEENTTDSVAKKSVVDPRPATSLATSISPRTKDESEESAIELGTLRHERGDSSEVEGARARLRVVGQPAQPQPLVVKNGSDTIAELENMLDNAIEEHGTKSHFKQTASTTNDTTPALTTSPVQQGPSHKPRQKSMDLARQQYHGHRYRSSSDSIAFRSSEESTRRDYGHLLASSDGYTVAPTVPTNHESSESTVRAQSEMRSGQAMSGPGPSISSNGQVHQTTSHHHYESHRPTHVPAFQKGSLKPVAQRAVDERFHQLQAPVTTRAIAGRGPPSPVKQRAAMWEDLLKRPSRSETAYHALHEQHFHGKQTRPENEASGKTNRFVRRFTKDKFENALEDSSLISLTLPQLVDPPRQSSNTSLESSQHTVSEYKTPPQTEDESKPVVGSDHKRKASFGWLAKLNPFHAPMPSPAGMKHETVQADRRADGQHSTHRPSIVQSRVHSLLEAAEQKSRGGSPKEELARPVTRQLTRDKGATKESEVKGYFPADGVIEAKKVPPLQIPVGEQGPFVELKDQHTFAEDVARFGNIQEGKPTLSLDPAVLTSAAEKEVTATVLRHSRAPSVRSGSPTKSGPSTPVRGRAMVAKPVTPGGDHYTVEQRFALSPGPSRSHSRASRGVIARSVSRTSRGGVKIEVEVRGSPDRRARERGDAIVIVRANLESAGSQDEEEHSRSIHE